MLEVLQVHFEAFFGNSFFAYFWVFKGKKMDVYYAKIIFSTFSFLLIFKICNQKIFEEEEFCDWLRVVAWNATSYELRYFQTNNEEEERDDEC